MQTDLGNGLHTWLQLDETPYVMLLLGLVLIGVISWLATRHFIRTPDGRELLRKESFWDTLSIAVAVWVTLLFLSVKKSTSWRFPSDVVLALESSATPFVVFLLAREWLHFRRYAFLMKLSRTVTDAATGDRHVAEYIQGRVEDEIAKVKHMTDIRKGWKVRLADPAKFQIACSALGSASTPARAATKLYYATMVGSVRDSLQTWRDEGLVNRFVEFSAATHRRIVVLSQAIAISERDSIEQLVALHREQRWEMLLVIYGEQIAPSTADPDDAFRSLVSRLCSNGDGHSVMGASIRDFLVDFGIIEADGASRHLFGSKRALSPSTNGVAATDDLLVFFIPGSTGSQSDWPHKHKQVFETLWDHLGRSANKDFDLRSQVSNTPLQMPFLVYHLQHGSPQGATT